MSKNAYPGRVQVSIQPRDGYHVGQYEAIPSLPMNSPPRASDDSRMRPNPWVRDGRGSVFLAWIMWFMIALLLIPSSYLSGNMSAQALYEMGQANVFARTVKLALILLSAIIVFRRRALAFLVLRSLNRFFILFLILVPLSILWSIDPAATSARYVSLLSIVLVCFAFVLMSWHPRRFQQVLRPVLIAILAASIIFGIISPDLAIEQGEGTLRDAWRGLTSQKNEFGMLGSFAFILWMHAWLTRESQWWKALMCCGIAGTCVLLSRSSTSLLSTLLAGSLMLLLLRSPTNLRRYMPFIVGLFAVVVVIYAVAVLNIVPGLDAILSPFAAVTGKDLTFSNRSEIWKIVKEHVQLSPYIGTGYGAYWVGPFSTSPSYVFLARMYFYPTESHNGYLEIVNDLGFLGLACLLGYLFLYVRQSLQLMKVDRHQGVLFLCFFFQQAMANLSESSWLSASVAFAFIIMTLATFTLARSLLDDRFKRYFGSPGVKASASKIRLR